MTPALRGRIDEASRFVLRGWAHDDRRPGRPVSLLVTLDGALLGRIVANRFRQDLLQAGVGDGRHGFELRFETTLSPLRPHQLRVCGEEDGADLARSPWVVQPAGALEDADLARLGDLLLDGIDENPVALEKRVQFLIEQLDRLLDHRAVSAGAAGWRDTRRHDVPGVDAEGSNVPGADGSGGGTTDIDSRGGDTQEAAATRADANRISVPAAKARAIDVSGADAPGADVPEGDATGADEGGASMADAGAHTVDAPEDHVPGADAAGTDVTGVDRAGSGTTGAGARIVDAADGGAATSGLCGMPLALVIDEVMPDAARDAGSNAVLSHMHALRRLGYRVLFAAADPAANPALAAALRRAGIETCAVPFYATVEEVLRRHGATLRVVYLHRGSLGSRYARLVRHHCRHARLLLSVADLQHLRLARQARIEHRDELVPLARLSQSQELDAMLQADAVLTHSAMEAQAIAAVLPGKPVHQAMWTASTWPISTPFAARYGVAFLADYAHAPNLEAARRLVCEIMPLVWEHEPTLPCLLAGSHLPHGLDGGDPRIRWIGHVPILQSLFERVRLSVAPLSFGAGIKGKVLESLAAGVPCACTPIAAEGLRLPHALEAMVAEDMHGIARLILRLHRDPVLNAEAARAGLDWAATHLSQTALDTALLQAIKTRGPKVAVPAG